MQTRPITPIEMSNSHIKDRDGQLRPVVEISGRTYVQVDSVKIEIGPQSITCLDVTEEMVLTRNGKAYVSIPEEGRYFLVLCAVSYTKSGTEWQQILPSDISLNVTPVLEVRDILGEGE